MAPKPILDAEHLDRAKSDYAVLFSDQPPLSGPLSLHEAVARALKFNFDKRLAMMETVLQERQLDLSTYNMLPRLAADAGYTTRNNDAASSSFSVLTGRQSLEPSVSQDRQRWTADLAFSWNLLDFGVSYFQAKQQADRAMIAVERKRRVVNNMIKEVRAAYWRAATAQRLLPKIDPILAEAEKARAASLEIEKQQLQPVVETLEYQKNLLQVVGQLKRLKSDLTVAKAQLAALINVPPLSDYTLDVPKADAPAMNLKKLTVAPARLELAALASRPELREEAYQARVDRNSLYKELIKLLPGATLLGSLNYDSNSYLKNQVWAEAGFRATWNLVGLISAPATIAASEAQEEVTRTRRLALSVAVLTQVNISYQQLDRALEVYETADAVESIETRIMKAVNDGGALEARSDLDRIRRSLSAISAELERDRALAELQTALASLYISVGMDPIPASLEIGPLPALTVAIKDALAQVDSGAFPNLPELPEPPKPVAAEPEAQAEMAAAPAPAGAVP
ncbi:MAG TPA: TolC family protein [Azospirillum sp.]|nr:TolC family protein [Azospirillum sp.]